MSDAREGLQELAASLARELVAERFAEEAMTLEQMEAALAEVKRELGDRLQRAWVERQEPKAQSRAACSACGGRARFIGSRERLLVTRHGECSFRRRSDHGSACREGFAPLDRRLGWTTTLPRRRCGSGPPSWEGKERFCRACSG